MEFNDAKKLTNSTVLLKKNNDFICRFTAGKSG
jgi:hypothetical protein